MDKKREHEPITTCAPPGREEAFPMQEQVNGPITSRTEKPAAVIFAERLAGSGPDIAAPIFVP